MSADAFVDRRGFVAGCVGAVGWWLLPTANAAIEPARLIGVSVIVDPVIEVAAAFGAALIRGGARCHSLRGDRYRSVRSVLNAAELPVMVAGMGTYADFIVATGVLREGRYAMVAYGVHSLSTPPDHRCFGHWQHCESALRRSNATWPTTLAAVIAQPTTRAPPPDEATSVRDLNAGVVMSWVMRSRGTRRTL